MKHLRAIPLLVLVGTLSITNVAVAQAQPLEIVAVNSGRGLIPVADQQHVWAVRHRPAGAQSTFAIAAVGNGPGFALNELTLDAANPVPSTVMVQISSGTRIYGLAEAMGVPRIATALGMGGGRGTLRTFGANVNVGGFFLLTDPARLELDCARSDAFCAVVFDNAGTIQTMRFQVGSNMGIGIGPQTLTSTFPLQWDIAYDNHSAVVTSTQTGAGNPWLGIESLPIGLIPPAAAPRIFDRSVPHESPRIACTEFGGRNTCMTIAHQNGILRARSVGEAIAGAPTSVTVFDGSGRANRLLFGAYDVAPGPAGYRIAYFATLGVITQLLVVDSSPDGSVLGEPAAFVYDPNLGTPRNVRIADAVDPRYSLVTWIQGDGAAAVNRAVVVRPGAPAMPDVFVGDATTDDVQPMRDVIAHDEPPAPTQDVVADSPASRPDQGLFADDALSTMDATPADAGTPPSTPTGCGCSTPAQRPSPPIALTLLALAATIVLHQRNRSQSRPS